MQTYSRGPKRHGHQGNRKIAQVRTRPSTQEIETALSEGVELDTEWRYTALITAKHAVRYYNECKANPFTDAEWTSNVETRPFN
jgi:hypothetical protein